MLPIRFRPLNTLTFVQRLPGIDRAGLRGYVGNADASRQYAERQSPAYVAVPPSTASVSSSMFAVHDSTQTTPTVAGSSACSTPTVSRAGSISVSDGSEFAAESDMPNEWDCPICSVPCTGTERERHRKREAKKLKEQQARLQHAKIIQDGEDALMEFAEYTPSTKQTAGNGSSAGVEGLKISTMRSVLALALKYLQEGRQKAIEQGREREWVEEHNRFLRNIDARSNSKNGTIDCDLNTSFKGYWCDPTDKRPCTRPKAIGQASEHKRCWTHCNGSKTPVQCRKDRVREAFYANKPGSKKRLLSS